MTCPVSQSRREVHHRGNRRTLLLKDEHDIAVQGPLRHGPSKAACPHASHVGRHERAPSIQSLLRQLLANTADTAMATNVALMRPTSPHAQTDDADSMTAKGTTR